jgi:(heptosyl)LPS beta-1,4-glucosyltransferase
MKNLGLSVVIIARNEEEMIGGAIESADFADKVIVVDGGSDDNTVPTARQAGAEVFQIKQKKLNFSRWRNQALKYADGDWVFYLDADERITKKLKSKLEEIINQNKNQMPKYSAYAIPRENYYLGKRVKHGGSWPDYVIRFFYRPNFKQWKGKLHEQPEFEGRLKHLQAPLDHYTHRDLTSMLKKSIKWTESEAKLLYSSDHPKVTWWRIGRMMLTKFWQRLIKQGAWKDGTVGWINAIFEVFNTFIIYARLWEKQKNG